MITLYNNNLIKKQLPDKNIILLPNTEIEQYQTYIIKGYYKEDNFIATENPSLLKTMKFQVKHIIYNDIINNYYLFSANIIEYQNGNELPIKEKVTISGYFYNLYKDSIYSAEGYWKHTEKSDKFVITEYSQITNSSVEILKNYLTITLKGSKIGTKTIEKLVNTFSTKTLSIIKNDDEKLKEIIKNDEKREKIKKIINYNEEKEKSLEYLIRNNFSICDALKVIEKFGPLTYREIKNNPNKLFEIPNISIKLIDNISINENFEFNNKERIKGLIIRYIMKKEKENGDIYVDYNEFINDTNKNNFIKFTLEYGAFKEKISTIEIASALNELNHYTNKISIENNILDNSKLCVYRQYYLTAENYIVNKLYELKNDICINYIPDDFIEKEISNSSLELDIIQKEGIKKCLQNKISILTGGPGTGKTQITKFIVNIFNKYYPNKKIELCAPTGRASKRMSEVINLPAQTIHKKLNCIPFSDMDLTEIDADLLIIDEVSMIDIDLFYKLLSNISEQTSIILVGDYNQLPSVGPGLILRDLINSNQITHIKLEKIFRQKNNSNIIDAAYKVLNGQNLDKYKKIKDSDFIFYDVDNDFEITKIIKDYLSKMIEHHKINPSDIQILTASNDGELGTTGLNELFKNIVNPKTEDDEFVYLSPTKIFHEKDRIIQTKNNYQLKVFNGSIGYINSINLMNNTIDVEFYDDNIEYKLNDLRDLKLAYAITVHKSQGSEFDYIIMPIARTHMFVNNINLLYTAITRTKIKFILIGQENTLKEILTKREHFSRKSQIKDKLIKKGKP